MSHYVQIKSQYRDKAALVAALERCGVPKEAISIQEKNTGSTITVNSGIVKTFLDTVFHMADAPGVESRVQIDPYAWNRTSLKGMDGKHESGAWLNRVRMEYDAYLQIQKAKAMGRQWFRVDQKNTIVVGIRG